MGTTTTTTRQSTNDIVNKVAAAVVTTTTATTTTTTTTRRTTRRPTTQPPSSSVTEDQGIIARIGNVINSGVDNIGNNLVAGGALIAAAASPLWAGLLVGKKRKRRSETSAHLNEIPVDQKPLNWHAKMIQNYIQQL